VIHQHCLLFSVRVAHENVMLRFCIVFHRHNRLQLAIATKLK
jgi:hypothetical protein